MSQSDNPFVRGFQHLSTQRLLAIGCEPGDALLYLPLHESQSHLKDAQLLQRPINFGETFALKPDETYKPTGLLAECPSIGWVQTVVHALISDIDGKTQHVCDTYSHEAAKSLIRQIRFDNGVYSRCWEISTAHVCTKSLHYLHGLIQSSRPTPHLFGVFHIPDGNVLGIKFSNTPWTDRSLMVLEDTTAEDLRKEHEQAGIPPMLVNLLHLAGEADVRLLLLDPDAPLLEGLAVNDDEEPSRDQGEFTY